MNRSLLSLGCVLGLLAGCGETTVVTSGTATSPPGGGAQTLVAARQGFQTQIPRRAAETREAVPDPPPNVFRKIRYPAAAGELAGYLTPDPGDGQKHPAIIWITGGDCNSIGEVWEDAPPSNDQTAAAYRKSGIVMFFPSLRGGNDNPGVKEGFLGEVDDVLAAADYLVQQPFVDPARIYLGGHSTGGTLVLLVAECSTRFRAVFSFGPVDDVSGYGPEYLPFDTSNPKEIELRSPGFWLESICSPAFVIEGTARGNFAALRTMSSSTKNPQVQFLPVQRANHFNVLAPVNQLIAQRILLDTGPTCNLKFTADELADAVGK